MDHPRIVQTADTCFGKPRIRDRRVSVEVIVHAVAAEGDLAEVAKAYAVDLEDVKAALHYAADRVARARPARMLAAE